MSARGRMVRAMTMRMMSVVVAALALAVVLVPVAVEAQDIEALASRRGIALPQAYYDQVARDPDMYEFRHGFFNRFGRLDRRVPGVPLAAPQRLSTSSFGEVRIPVILAAFADSPAEPHITTEMVQQALFDGPAARGTITESYLEMSRDQLTVLGDVYGWTRSSLTMSQVVGTDRSFGPDNQVGTYLLEALAEVDPEVDFTQYDNDGPDGVPNSGDDDGYVDVITFEFLEIAASCGGPAIWPHRSSVQSRAGNPFVTDDVGFSGENILVQDYITQSASDCTGQGVQDAGVISHEFGHALGLPDWYHWIDGSLGPFGRRWVLGCWALMAAGAWGCGPVTEERPQFGPTHLIGYSKAWLGWIDAVDPGELRNEELVLGPIETTGDLITIQLDDVGDEFLHIEFRDLIGFDHELPAAGVLMYKQDDNASLRPDPATNDPYFLQMLEQDNNNSMRLMAAEGGSRGERSDAWGVAGISGKLNGDTGPELLLRDGRWSRVMIHEVYVEEGQARVILSNAPTPVLVQPSDPFEVERVRTFTAPVRIAGGRGPFTGVGTLPEGYSFFAAGDALSIVGSSRDTTPLQFTFGVQDSDGNLSPDVTITVDPSLEWTVAVENLLQEFLESGDEAITPGEKEYLDDLGNANGRYDVGDLRAWMRRN